MKMFKQGLPLRALWSGAAAALVLSACGGGGGQVEPFKPTRIIALGDESSLITPAGKKYSVNALVAQTDATLPDKLDCKTNPVWVQRVANNFGLVFPQCNPDNVVSTTGLMYAQVGAKVADVKTQIDGHLAGGSFNPKDLVTVLVGMYDVLELYGQYPTQSQGTLLALAEQRGQTLAEQVNRIVNANGRAIFVLMPDMGLTPFALAEKAGKPVTGSDLDRAAFLSALTARLNSKLRLGVINDGRLIGLINGAEMVQQSVAIPGLYNFVNTNKVACSVALPDCTTKTMTSTTDSAGTVTKADGTTWLWADDTRLGAGMHSRLGDRAYQAASIHPF